MRRSVLTLVLLAAAAIAGNAQSTDIIEFKSDKLDASGAKFLKGEETILIPTVVLQVSQQGEASIKAGGGMLSNAGGVARAKGKYVVSGIDKALLQDAARQVEEDLVKRLRGVGLTVVTYADVKDHPEVVAMKRYVPKPEFGLPTDKIVSNTYLVTTPTDEQNFDPPLQGYHWGFRKVAKDKTYTVVIPVYTVDAPQIWGEKEEGYKRASAGINILPGMNFNGGIVWILNAKGGGGVLKLKSPVRDASEDVGTIDDEDKSPTAANAINKIGGLFGASTINSKSTAFYLTADPAKYKVGLLRGGFSINALVADAAKTAKDKK
jgi:hypothetical protein